MWTLPSGIAVDTGALPSRHSHHVASAITKAAPFRTATTP
jgi:hypothetical protein